MKIFALTKTCVWLSVMQIEYSPNATGREKRYETDEFSRRKFTNELAKYVQPALVVPESLV